MSFSEDSPLIPVSVLSRWAVPYLAATALVVLALGCSGRSPPGPSRQVRCGESEC